MAEVQRERSTEPKQSQHTSNIMNAASNMRYADSIESSRCSLDRSIHRLVLELLAANGGLHHQTASWKSEHHDAITILGI
jgi:hypothetical protein